MGVAIAVIIHSFDPPNDYAHAQHKCQQYLVTYCVSMLSLWLFHSIW